MLAGRRKLLFLIWIVGLNVSLSYAETAPEDIIQSSLADPARASKVRSFLDKLTPYLEVKESINDNIFRTSEDIEGDFVNEISPGIRYGDRSSQSRTGLFFDVGVIIKTYSEHDEHNVENPYFDFLFSRGAGMFGLDLEYRFEKGQDTFTDLSATASEGFVDYFSHKPKLSLNVDWNRFLWEFSYYHRGKSYEEGAFKVPNSYNEDAISFNGSLRLFPKTYVFLEYDRRWRDYTKGGRVDRYYDEYWLGVRGKLSAKVEGLVKFGYEEGHFPEEDKSSGAVNINLNYRPSRRLLWNLEVEQGIGSSTFSTDELNKSQFFALGCRYSPPFNKKLQLAAKVSLGFDEYDSGREDKSYGFTLSSEYGLTKWLKIVGEYEFQKEESGNTLAQYKNNIASLKLMTEF